MHKLLAALLLCVAATLVGCQTAQGPVQVGDHQTRVDDFAGTPVLFSLAERSAGSLIPIGLRKRPTLYLCQGDDTSLDNAIKVGERRTETIWWKLRQQEKNPLAADNAAIMLLDLQPGRYSLCGYAIVDATSIQKARPKKLNTVVLAPIHFDVGDEPLYLGEWLFKWLDGYSELTVNDEHDRDVRALNRIFMRLDKLTFSTRLLPVSEPVEAQW